MTETPGSTAPAQELMAPPASQVAKIAPTSGLIDGNMVYDTNDLMNIYGAIEENTDAANDIRISRVTIMQLGSPEVADRSPGYEPGMLVDNLTRTILTEKVKAPWLLAKGVPADGLVVENIAMMVPIMRLPDEYIKWKDMNTEGRGFHWKSFDPKDPRVIEGTWPVWKEEGAPPVTQNINWLCLPMSPTTNRPIGIPIVVSFYKTSFNNGKKMCRMVEDLKAVRLLPWQKTFYLRVPSDQNDKKQTYYMIEPIGGILVKSFDTDHSVEADCYKMAKALANPDSGKALQMAMISAAHLDNTESSQGGESGSVSATGAVACSSQPKKDPF